MKHVRLLMALCISIFAISAAGLAGEDSTPKKERSKRGWIGVAIQDVTPKFAREKDLNVKEGVYVNDVVDESPADSAGIKEGDVITEFNGKKIEITDDLIDAVRETKPGTKATISIQRGDAKKSLSINVGKDKSARNFAFTMPMMKKILMRTGEEFEGASLMELNKQLGEYFETAGGKGLLVKEIEKSSNADKAGLKAGDVLVKVNKENVSDFSDLQDAIEDAKEGDKIAVEFLRKGKKQTASVEISAQKKERKNMFWNFPGPGMQFHFDQDFPTMEFEHDMQNRMRDAEIKIQRIPKIHREIKVRSKADEV
jgi:serine protease Do